MNSLQKFLAIKAKLKKKFPNKSNKELVRLAKIEYHKSKKKE